MVDKIFLVPLLPLSGFLINIFLKDFYSKTIAGIIAISVTGLSFLITLIIFWEFHSVGLPYQKIDYYTFASIGSFELIFSLLVDPLSLLMMLIVTGVGFLIHIFSVGYMHHDENYAKFFSYMNLFMFCMLLLVSSSNYFFMFIGWEGVGFCSYLLIGFWYKNLDFSKAGMKAFIMNRAGDMGFLSGIMLLYAVFGSLDFITIFDKIHLFKTGDTILVIITLLLFIGATAKSAQIPLFTWLPDAMAGPTPVSALIHAATMVTAGIYMICRSSVLFAMAPLTLNVIAITGLATALLAACIALTQNDIKKVLAYSTVSQLGFMFIAIGTGAFTGAMFHLMTHAFFKALLFLCTGSVIHALSGEQDIRNMGNLRKHLPITFSTFLIATIAIAGIPPLSGFFSKDEILAHAFEYNSFFWLLTLIAALMTAFYMFRLLYLTFYGNFRGTEKQIHHLHESPGTMTVPLILLAVLSVTGGWIGIPEILGGHNYFKNFLTPVFLTAEQILTHLGDHPLSHSAEFILMIVSVILIMISILYARHIFFRKAVIPSLNEKEYSPLHKLSYYKFYVDELYYVILIKPMHWIHTLLNNRIEAGIIDNMVNTIGNLTLYASGILRYLQSGRIGFYIFMMVIGMIFLFILNFII